MRNAARQACRQVRWAGRRPAGSASLWLLVLVTCAAAAVWPGSSTAADHRPSAAADPQLALPAPTGRWPVGVRSDFVVQVRGDVLVEIDGPMLKHGIQAMHGIRLTVPHHRAARPDAERLEQRYEEFLAAG